MYTVDGINSPKSVIQFNELSERLRKAIIDQLPDGAGVGDVSIVNHGVYEGAQGSLK